jgi:hypothetical protein
MANIDAPKIGYDVNAIHNTSAFLLINIILAPSIKFTNYVY